MRALRPSWTLFLRALSGTLIAAAACGTGESVEAGADPPSIGTIDPEPLLVLGGEAAPPDQRFAGITGVYRLPGGSTVVADASRRLRWFDSNGELVRIVGGRGVEPGGGRAYAWMSGYRRDSLIAYDALSAHLSVLDSAGSVARRFALTSDYPSAFVELDSPFPDGSLLAMAGPVHVQQWADGWWAALQLLGFTPDGNGGEDLGTALLHPCEATVERCATEYNPYHGTWIAGRSGVYIARPDRTEIRFVAIDSADQVLEGPEGWERGPEGGVPTYSGLTLDPEGGIWAQSGDRSQVAVFDREGELAGTVQVPSKLQIYQIGSDFVVGVIEGHRGIERVQVHRLHRNATLSS